MIYCTLSQSRLPEHFGWEITITAHFVFDLIPDEIGIPEEHENRIGKAFDEVFDGSRHFRTKEDARGSRIAQLTGILFRDFLAFDQEDLVGVVEKESQFGSGTFDAMGGAHIASRFFVDWAASEACFEFIDWDNFSPSGIFACNEFICAPGVRSHPLLCRLLAEMESHIGKGESIFAIHQEFSTSDLSSHQDFKHTNDLMGVPAIAKQHGFRALVVGAGARMEGREIETEVHLGFEHTPKPEDLATIVFALEGEDFNKSKILWPAETGVGPEAITRYLDPLTWVEHELGLEDHPRPAGSDIPDDELRAKIRS